MTKKPISHLRDTKKDLHKTLIERITQDLNAGIREYGEASMVVSGGSTPKALFEKLSHVDFPW